jgi:uncharacterized protein (DUF58 family)
VKTPHPLLSCSGIALNGCGLFLLPFVIGGAASLFLEVSEVADTAHVLLGLALVFILPPMLLQAVGVVIKVGREKLLLQERRQWGLRAWLASTHRHMRIVTPRGWAALLTGLWFVLLALGAKWADLGILAVLSLLLFYVVLGYTSFFSTFHVAGFQRGIGRGKGTITREMSPAVVLSGEEAEERWLLHKVPVPAGFTLLLEDENLPELATESRYAVGASVQRSQVTLSGRFRRTPRGLHRLGPAHIWYQDMLGFTRVSVASMATAELKVLPRFRPLQIVEPPRSRLEAPDVLTVPHRFATEDHFKFKEYIAGDDTRRIHWRLSIRSGKLQVRMPETRETTTRQVVLLLDSYMPRGRMVEDAVGIANILDALVETWISLCDELVQRGDRVTLVSAADDGSGNIRVERVDSSADTRRWQDLGARVRWQSQLDLEATIGQVGKDIHAVVVSARFAAPPQPSRMGGKDYTWVYYPPIDALGPPEPSWWEQWVGPGPGAPLRLIARLVRLPAPAGSDENGFVRQWQDAFRLFQTVGARQRLRFLARREGARTLDQLKSRGDTVYRLEPGVHGHRLVGVVSGGGR